MVFQRKTQASLILLYNWDAPSEWILADIHLVDRYRQIRRHSQTAGANIYLQCRINCTLAHS